MLPDYPKKNNGLKRGNFTKKSSIEQETPAKKPKITRKFDFSRHPKRKIALKFLYFGWEYDGLVQQANTEMTVEKHLMDALTRTCLISSWKDCDVSRCGRTDKGVSAFKQVTCLVVRSADTNGDHVFWDKEADPEIIANYKRSEELPYIRMLNGVLPPHIRITAWAPVPMEFSARHKCNRRVYKYCMPKANLDIERMQKACAYLVGEHDFRNFCQIDSNEARVLQTYIRRIFDAKVELIRSNNDPYELIELTVTGSGFLWHMIRYIVTVLHEVGQGNEEPELVVSMLDITKTPCRPQYGLAVETPLCLFDCSYDTSELKWREDETAMEKTIIFLQATLADFSTKAQLIKNMINELQGTGDANKGLLQFTQDRPLPAKYIPFNKRPVCESLESKLEKLKKKQQVVMQED